MELPHDMIAKLRRLVRAGAEGLQLADIGTGTALFFGLHGLASITNTATPPQRVIATTKAPSALRHAEMESYL